jgi:hypothetical protein
MRMIFVVAAMACILVSETALGQSSSQFQPGYKPGGEPAAADGTLGVAELFAVVTSAGAISRGAGTVSSIKFSGAGQYEVAFNRDVSQCVYVGSVAELGGLIPSAGQIGVAPRAGKANGVFIQTRDGAGGVANRNFMLKVSCVR